jgi:hypothetical protein
VLFGFANAPEKVQTSIENYLQPNIHDFTLCYLDDILTYSTNVIEHEHHVWNVGQWLQEFGIYSNAVRCQFMPSEVSIVGLIINKEAIGMESHLICTGKNWPTLKSVCDVHVLVGIANFYRRFISNYAKVTLPLTELLRKTETSNALKTSQKSNKPTCKL